ncbi:MAG TPA: hypothetical protein VMY39_00395, partial [Planctomycetota bacterium]|nr:hypothetical protein [Planctomycetota bacterium]
MTEPHTPTTLEDPVARVLSRAARGRAALIWAAVAGYVVIAAAFVPWWTMTLQLRSAGYYFNMADVPRAEMKEQMQAAVEENERFRDFAARYGVARKLGWIGLESAEYGAGGGPHGGGDSLSVHVWGYDSTSGRLAMVLGLGVVVCAMSSLLWPAVRKRRWLPALVAIVLALSLLVVGVLWFFTTPQRDVRNVFTRGVSWGVTMCIAGSLVVIAAMTHEVLVSARIRKGRIAVSVARVALAMEPAPMTEAHPPATRDTSEAPPPGDTLAIEPIPMTEALTLTTLEDPVTRVLKHRRSVPVPRSAGPLVCVLVGGIVMTLAGLAPWWELAICVHGAD